MSKFLLLLFVAIITAEDSSCPQYCNRQYQDRSDILSHLPYYQRFDNLSLIGTYVSAGYENSYTFENQFLHLSDQLKYGVRVFDFGVRPTSSHFAIHNGVYFLNIMFGYALKIFIDFIYKNPNEVLIVLLHQVYSSAADVTMDNCRILQRYSNSGRIVKKWSLEDCIGQHRGNILLATTGDDYNDSFSECITDLREKCKLSSDIDKSTWVYNSAIDWKSKEMIALQEASFGEDYKCFINIIANYGDEKSMNEFIAVKGDDYIHDNCEEPINYKMANYFRNPHRALVIVLADYPTQSLIDRINWSNYPNHSL